jgi:predicted regulator of Ras-like GTPase activity (Roadblock/LC7/MglB family)
MSISQDVPSNCIVHSHEVEWRKSRLNEQQRRPLRMEERMVDLKQMLSRFLTIPGVRLAVLVGRDGLLIEGLSRDSKEDMETVGAYMTTGLNTAEALGQEISRGSVIGVLMEYEQGLVSVDPLGDFALVVTLFDNAASIGRVRHMVKASRNEILQALEIA